MEYDPIKDKIGSYVGEVPWRRRLFYKGLDLLFLRAWYVHRMIVPAVREIEARSDGRPVRVLDAGSGFGQYTYFLLDRFPSVEVTAVDVKTDYLETCRRFFDRVGMGDRVRWFQADLTDESDYPFTEEDTFDIIICVDVMEHIERDRTALRNMARVLRPGGYLLINTPSDEGGSAVTEEGQESFIGEHARDGYNMRDLEDKIAGAGLRAVRSVYAYGPYGSAAWRLLIQAPMKMLSLHWLMILLLPVYYLPVFPVGMLLHAIDVRRRNDTGTGLTVLAQNPSSAEHR